MATNSKVIALLVVIFFVATQIDAIRPTTMVIEDVQSRSNVRVQFGINAYVYGQTFTRVQTVKKYTSNSMYTFPLPVARYCNFNLRITSISIRLILGRQVGRISDSRCFRPSVSAATLNAAVVRSNVAPRYCATITERYCRGWPKKCRCRNAYTIRIIFKDRRNRAMLLRESSGNVAGGLVRCGDVSRVQAAKAKVILPSPRPKPSRRPLRPAGFTGPVRLTGGGTAFQ